ncbi:MAG: hypothetical protein HQL02_03145 [Nitrospirae bacterium]|nr:hypothetical protein [Nitrospirota bacterium]
MYKYPIIEKIRKKHNDTTDINLINKEFSEELKHTRFLGMGNPPESGVFLLYYFRQENKLSRELFIHSHQIFSQSGGNNGAILRENDVKRYIYIDDLCGSGTQAIDYSEDILENIKKLNPEVEVDYYVLFSTTKGLNNVRDYKKFNRVECIFELDDSYKCLENDSRYFANIDANIDASKGVCRDFARRMCKEYGKMLSPKYPLGYGDCQLLMAFNYNTPDNSLPIFWYDGEYHNNVRWIPVFKRYDKIY